MVMEMKNTTVMAFGDAIHVHSILFYSIRLPGFDGHEKKERLAVLRVI